MVGNDIGSHLIEVMIGSGVFPVVKNASFVACLCVVVEVVGRQGHEYLKCGVHRQLNISQMFAKSIDAVLSVTNAYELAVSCGALQNTQEVYVSLINVPPHIDYVYGASEGLAIVIAMFGGRMAGTSVCATGYIDVIGIKTLTRAQAEQIPIKTIDSAGAKAKGIADRSMRLVLPHGNMDDVNSDFWGIMIPVWNVGDALKAVNS